MGGRRMNKKEIDAWLKDLDERHEKQLWKEGIKWKEEDKDSRYYGEIRSDLDTEYHYVVVIPEDVYELLAPDEQAKFDGCDLTDWMDDMFIVDEFDVEPDDLNELWQRKFYDLHDGDNDDEGKWTSLGNPNNGKPVNEVLVFNM